MQIPNHEVNPCQDSRTGIDLDMVLKLILTKGLPASGKTTWAKTYLQAHPKTANLCKDDLRLQLPDSQEREDRVVKVRDLLTEHYLSEGYSVIWSDTNLNPIHTQRAAELTKPHQAQLIIQDFTHVALTECIRRDLLRLHPVGQEVIHQMYQDYLASPSPKLEPLN